MNLYRIKFGNGRYATWSDMDPEWFGDGPGAIMATMSEGAVFSTPCTSNVEEKAKLIKESYESAGLGCPELWIAQFNEIGEVGLRKHGEDVSLPLKPVEPR